MQRNAISQLEVMIKGTDSSEVNYLSEVRFSHNKLIKLHKLMRIYNLYHLF